MLPSEGWNWFDPDVVAWQTRAGLTREFLRDVQELRRIVEPSAVRLAAERATPADIAAVETAYGGMKDAIEHGGVGPTSASRSPRSTRSENGAEDRPAGEAFRDALGLDDPFARHRRRVQRQRGGALTADLLATFLAQCRQRPHPALVALAPGRDAFDRPFAFRLDLAIELVALGILVVPKLVAPFLEAARNPDRAAAPRRGRSTGWRG